MDVKKSQISDRVYRDHAHVNGVGLLLMLIDFYSGWPEIIQVSNKEVRL